MKYYDLGTGGNDTNSILEFKSARLLTVIKFSRDIRNEIIYQLDNVKDNLIFYSI